MIDAFDIKNYLPHRAPMLMVDRIIQMDESVVESIFEIKADNIFVQNGTFLEAGIIENAAQNCSSVIGKGYFVDENNNDKTDVDVVGFISAIKTLKIHNLPKVGTTINTIATLVSKFVTPEYSLCTMSCQTYERDHLLFEAEINLFIQDNNSIKTAENEERISTTG
ncbi:ABC transporter permease [Flavobacterium sp. 3HN19-14]|uniref:ABC transporter permease n=1 Tax=Flavobacterium sp. 3HN19-14 TaxID=3448133 RepID=UPI003EE05F3E